MDAHYKAIATMQLSCRCVRWTLPMFQELEWRENEFGKQYERFISKQRIQSDYTISDMVDSK